jgi:hypothetical protein
MALDDLDPLDPADDSFDADLPRTALPRRRTKGLVRRGQPDPDFLNALMAAGGDAKASVEGGGPSAPAADNTSWMGDVARGVEHGLKVTLPKAAGQALEFFGAEDTGKQIQDAAQARETAGNRESATGQRADGAFSVRGNVYEAADNAMLSVAPGATGAAIGAGIGSVIPGVGTALGALAGYAVGSIGSLPIFYGSQAQETYEKVKKAQLEQGKSEQEADQAARTAGHLSVALKPVASWQLMRSRLALANCSSQWPRWQAVWSLAP